MKNLLVVVFSMDGCVHCQTFKKLLEENNITYFDRDIDKYEEEYEVFKKITKSDYVPALLVVEENDEDLKSYYYVPEKDFDQLEEAVELIKEHYSKITL
jgi:glutaredoxin